jgi:hypothetical protein
MKCLTQTPLTAMCWHSAANWGLSNGFDQSDMAPGQLEPAYVEVPSAFTGYQEFAPKFPPPSDPAPQLLPLPPGIEPPPGLEHRAPRKPVSPVTLPPGLEDMVGAKADNSLEINTRPPREDSKAADSFCVLGSLVPDVAEVATVRAEWHIAKFVSKLGSKGYDHPLVSPAMVVTAAEAADVDIDFSSARSSGIPPVTVSKLAGLKLMLETIPHTELQNLTKMPKQKLFAAMLKQKGKLSFGFTLKMPSALPATIQFRLTVGEGEMQARSEVFVYNMDESTTQKCSGFAGGGLTIGLEILAAADIRSDA